MTLMEILYTLVIELPSNVKLKFISRTFGDIQDKIIGFQEDFSTEEIRPHYSIDVNLEESVEANPDSHAARKKRVKARNGLRYNQVAALKRHTGRGRPKGWKKGMSFDEARGKPETDEEADSDPFNT